MKNFTTRLLLTASLVVLALGISAQVQAQTVVRCNVPFEFSLGGQTYPSGVYSFTVTSTNGSKTVLLRSWDGSQGRFAQASAEDESANIATSAQFRRYGTHYLLTSLSIGGDGVSLHFAPTRAEREMLVRANGEVVSVMASR